MKRVPLVVNGVEIAQIPKNIADALVAAKDSPKQVSASLDTFKDDLPGTFGLPSSQNLNVKIEIFASTAVQGSLTNRQKDDILSASLTGKPTGKRAAKPFKVSSAFDTQPKKVSPLKGKKVSAPACELDDSQKIPARVGRKRNK